MSSDCMDCRAALAVTMTKPRLMDAKASPPYGAPATTKTTTVNGVTYTGYSNSPQGGALRGKNYVRLVRG